MNDAGVMKENEEGGGQVKTYNTIMLKAHDYTLYIEGHNVMYMYNVCHIIMFLTDHSDLSPTADHHYTRYELIPGLTHIATAITRVCGCYIERTGGLGRVCARQLQ